MKSISAVKGLITAALVLGTLSIHAAASSLGKASEHAHLLHKGDVPLPPPRPLDLRNTR